MRDKRFNKNGMPKTRGKQVYIYYDEDRIYGVYFLGSCSEGFTQANLFILICLKTIESGKTPIVRQLKHLTCKNHKAKIQFLKKLF